MDGSSPGNGSGQVMLVIVAKNLRIGDKENPEMLIVRRWHGLPNIGPAQKRPPKTNVFVENDDEEDEDEKYPANGQLEGRWEKSEDVHKHAVAGRY